MLSFISKLETSVLNATHLSRLVNPCRVVTVGMVHDSSQVDESLQKDHFTTRQSLTSHDRRNH